MATRTQVLLEDDIDGGSASQTISFALRGASFEIDLSDENAERLQEAFGPFISNARRVGGSAARTTRRRARAGGTTTEDLQAIRAWAGDNGYQVSARGRISASVVEAYKLAH